MSRKAQTTSLTTTPAQNHSKLSDAEWQAKYDAMNDHLKDKFDSIQDFIRDEAVNLFRRRHRLGKEVMAITNDPAKYGKNAVEAMAELLDMDKSLVYNVKLFAERYSDDQLQDLIDAVLDAPKRRAVSWSHVTYLMRITDEKLRLEMQKRTIEENLTVSDLIQELQPEQDKPKTIATTASAGSGRQPKNSGTLIGHLSQFETIGRRLMKSYNDVWFADKGGFADTADELTDAEISVGLISRMQQAVDLAGKMSLAMENMARDLKLMVDKMELISNTDVDEAPEDLIIEHKPSKVKATEAAPF